eukprot:5088169-Ditylum_brightwellii.AAC.1
MYNEKWVWGLVVRAEAKACDELGMYTNTFHAYHKCHINKTMDVAFTGFAFQDTIKNGDDGSRRQTGPVMRKKGDAYLVDCNVTSSTYGTDSNPKFLLIKLSKE